MTAPVCGLRARLISDPFRAQIRVALEELGWFATRPSHLPVELIDAPKDWDEPIQLNSVAVTSDDVEDLEAELGSNLTEDRWTFYVDVYAEDDVIGTHLGNDIRDVLRGKIPSVTGGDTPRLDVYNFGLATPAVFTVCDIENVTIDQVREAPKPWQRYWYTVRAEIVDTYGDEND